MVGDDQKSITTYSSYCTYGIRPSSGSANALNVGDFFIGDAGFIQIIEQNEAHSGSVSGTTALGTVTVAVS